MISPSEILKGSILCHEGKPKIVKAIGDYILFMDAKAWIGGSMIEGEPLSVVWLDKLGFVYDSSVGGWTNGKIGITVEENGFKLPWSNFLYQYVHQLQLIHFIITQEHIKLPKIK